MPDESDFLNALELLTLHPDAPTPEGIGQDVNTIIQASRPWALGPNVVGNGVAPKITAGRMLSDLSFKVYVDKKLPRSSLDPSRIVPDTFELQGIVLVTDVEEIGTQRLESFTAQTRPLQPGYSIGQFQVETGTLGCIVAKNSEPTVPLLLSNSHVFAEYGLAPLGARIVQPGPSDGGGEAELVATLLEAVEFIFEPGYNNFCEAAIAHPENALQIVRDIPMIGAPSTTATDLRPGQLVQKSGRTTGHTVGAIKDIHYRTYMSFPRAEGGYAPAGFREQVLCEKYSDRGDSGALVTNMDGAAVGLHWAGSNSTSIFSPIRFVFSALDIQLWQP